MFNRSLNHRNGLLRSLNHRNVFHRSTLHRERRFDHGLHHFHDRRFRNFFRPLRNLRGHLPLRHLQDSLLSFSVKVRLFFDLGGGSRLGAVLDRLHPLQFLLNQFRADGRLLLARLAFPLGATDADRRRGRHVQLIVEGDQMRDLDGSHRVHSNAGLLVALLQSHQL